MSLKLQADSQQDKLNKNFVMVQEPQKKLNSKITTDEWSGRWRKKSKVLRVEL